MEAEYRVKLKQFEGPMDLLLHLIERSEVDIADIFISEITSQYLLYMDEIDELDMERASAFLTMAATLVYIKSRSLLPKVKAEEEDGEICTEEMLIQRLQEYKLFKQIGETLGELRESSRGMISKLPEEFPLPAPEITWLEGSPIALYAALKDMLERAEGVREPSPLHMIVSDEFTVRTRGGKLRELLGAGRTLNFDELIADCSSRMEIIVTFMAMLEMAAHGELSVMQDKPYGKIVVNALKLGNAAYDDTEDAEGEWN